MYRMTKGPLYSIQFGSSYSQLGTMECLSKKNIFMNINISQTCIKHPKQILTLWKPNKLYQCLLLLGGKCQAVI